MQVLVGSLSCWEFPRAAVLAGPEDTVLLASSQPLALTVSLLLPCSGSWALGRRAYVYIWDIDVQSVTPLTLILFTLMRHELLFTADPCIKKLLCDSLRALLIHGYTDTNLEGSLILCLDVFSRFCTFNFSLSEKDFNNWFTQLSTYKSWILTRRTEFIQRMDKNFA